MNPVVGDRALELEGDPTKVATMNDQEKVRCHLSFALQQLKNDTTTTKLGDVIESPRMELLSALESYIQDGVFPVNENETLSSRRRTPCFIDRFETPCAVAYLMQQSGARELAKEIASICNYGTIAEIASVSSQVESWSEGVGLSVHELALIQPTYEFEADIAETWFLNILSQLTEASKTNQKLSEDEIASIGRRLVLFGFRMGRRGIRGPQTRIPKFLKFLDKFEQQIPDNRSDIDALVKLFRKEVGGRLQGSTKPSDYQGVIPERDLEAWQEALDSLCPSDVDSKPGWNVDYQNLKAL